MQGKLVIILLLELTVGCLVIEMRVCSESVPDTCMNNINVNITKARDHYKLQLCYNDRCIRGDDQKWITCNKMCDVLTNNTTCGKNQSCCEVQVMSFLSSYCSRNTPPIYTTTVTERVTITPEAIRSVIKKVTLSPSYTVTALNQHLIKHTLSSAINKPTPMTAEQTNETNASSLTTLGVFLCLMVFALIVVTIGWILTYWTMKKKLSQKARYKVYTCTTR